MDISPNPPHTTALGLLMKNRCPQAPSYSQPMKIFSINTWFSMASFCDVVGLRCRLRALSMARDQDDAFSRRTWTSHGSRKLVPTKNPLCTCSGKPTARQRRHGYKFLSAQFTSVRPYSYRNCANKSSYGQRTPMTNLGIVAVNRSDSCCVSSPTDTRWWTPADAYSFRSGPHRPRRQRTRQSRSSSRCRLRCPTVW